MANDQQKAASKAEVATPRETPGNGEPDQALVDRLAVVRHRALDVRVGLLITLLTADDRREDEQQEKSGRTVHE